MRLVIRLTTTLALLFAGVTCGNNKSLDGCQATMTGITVNPSSANANHAAVPPGNQAMFMAIVSNTYPPGCAIPQVLAPAQNVTWSVSDQVNVSLSAGQFGAETATCLGSTTATIKASAPSTSNAAVTFTSTATLTCQ